MAEMFGNDTSKLVTYLGEPLLRSSIANPCGLFAKAFFNGIDNYFILNDRR
jgi:hypothetical protein